MLARAWKPLGHRLPALAAAVAVAMLAAPGAASAASPGTPNSGFGSGGSAKLVAGTRLFGAAMQSNGDLVAVGEAGAASTPRLLVVRFTPSGGLDGSFGSGGYALGPAVSGSPGTIGRGVAIAPDGKIVVAGQATDSTATGAQGLLVERFNANGSPDTSFGSGGVVNELSGQTGSGYAVAVQPNGDVVAAGTAAPGATPYVAVERLTPKGALDGSFGSGGIDILNLGAYSIAQAVALQPNGAIVIAGSQSPTLQAVNALIARLKPSGALDSSFAGSGATAKQYAPAGGAYSAFNSVLVQGNGEIDAIGSTSGGNSDAFAVVARFRSNGSADTGFGSAGAAYATAAANYLGGQSNVTLPGANAGVIAPNGDVIVAGQFANSVITYGTLWAFNSSGSLDQSFGSHGAAVFNAGRYVNSEWGGLAISPTTGYLDPAGDTSSAGGHGYAGLAASYVGYGRPSGGGGGGGGTTSLKLTVSQIKTSYKGGWVRFKAACNTGCSLNASLWANAGTARRLKVTSRFRQCRRVHGRRKCRTVRGYRAVTLTTARGTLRSAGSKTFTLHLKRGETNALHHQRSVVVRLTVQAAAGGRKVKFVKNVTIKR